MNSKIGVTVLGLLTLTGFAVLPSACGGDTGSVSPKTDGGSSSGSSSGGSSSGSGSGSGSSSGSSSGGSTSSSGSSSGGSTSSSGSSSGSVPTSHRSSDAACGVVPPAGSCPFGSETASTCKSDSDCTAGLNGRCGPYKEAVPVCTCAYDACTKDADCAAGSTCACNAGLSGNACVASGCRVDSDCGTGGYCSPTVAVDPTCAHVGFAGYYCHTKSDECVNDSDCPGAPGPTGQPRCVYSAGKQHWDCEMVPLCAA